MLVLIFRFISFISLTRVWNASYGDGAIAQLVEAQRRFSGTSDYFITGRI